MRDEFQTSKRQDVCRAKCRPRPECTLHSRAANRKQPLEGVRLRARGVKLARPAARRRWGIDREWGRARRFSSLHTGRFEPEALAGCSASQQSSRQPGEPARLGSTQRRFRTASGADPFVRAE